MPEGERSPATDTNIDTVPWPIKAIVLDSNAFGRAVEPNVETIESWANACTNHSAELWIPQVVALELSQRVVASSNEFARKAKDHNTSRRRWGQPPLEVPDVLTVEEVIDATGR